MSELTNRRELRALRVGETLNGGTPQLWGLSAPYPDRGGREFSDLANFAEVPGTGISDADDDNGVARAPYTYVRSKLPLYTMGTGTTTWVQLCMLQNCVISRLCTGATQSRQLCKTSAQF